MTPKKIITAPQGLNHNNQNRSGEMMNIHTNLLALCTVCDKRIVRLSEARRHPRLRTLQCENCYDHYSDGDFSRIDNGVDSNGDDNYCRWCTDGGNLYLCAMPNCHNGFCENCITKNIGEEKKAEIELNEMWACLICDRSQIDFLVKRAKECIKSLEYQEAMRHRAMVEKSKNQEKSPVVNNVSASVVKCARAARDVPEVFTPQELKEKVKRDSSKTSGSLTRPSNIPAPSSIGAKRNNTSLGTTSSLQPPATIKTRTSLDKPKVTTANSAVSLIQSKVGSSIGTSTTSGVRRIVRVGPSKHPIDDQPSSTNANTGENKSSPSLPVRESERESPITVSDLRSESMQNEQTDRSKSNSRQDLLEDIPPLTLTDDLPFLATDQSFQSLKRSSCSSVLPGNNRPANDLINLNSPQIYQARQVPTQTSNRESTPQQKNVINKIAEKTTLSPKKPGPQPKMSIFGRSSLSSYSPKTVINQRLIVHTSTSFNVSSGTLNTSAPPTEQMARRSGTPISLPAETSVGNKDSKSVEAKPGEAKPEQPIVVDTEAEKPEKISNDQSENEPKDESEHAVNAKEEIPKSPETKESNLEDKIEEKDEHSKSMEAEPELPVVEPEIEKLKEISNDQSENGPKDEGEHIVDDTEKRPKSTETKESNLEDKMEENEEHSKSIVAEPERTGPEQPIVVELEPEEAETGQPMIVELVSEEEVFEQPIVVELEPEEAEPEKPIVLEKEVEKALEVSKDQPENEAKDESEHIIIDTEEKPKSTETKESHLEDKMDGNGEHSKSIGAEPEQPVVLELELEKSKPEQLIVVELEPEKAKFEQPIVVELEPDEVEPEQPMIVELGREEAEPEQSIMEQEVEKAKEISNDQSETNEESVHADKTTEVSESQKIKDESKPEDKKLEKVENDGKNNRNIIKNQSVALMIQDATENQGKVKNVNSDDKYDCLFDQGNQLSRRLEQLSENIKELEVLRHKANASGDPSRLVHWVRNVNLELQAVISTIIPRCDSFCDYYNDIVSINTPASAEAASSAAHAAYSSSIDPLRHSHGVGGIKKRKSNKEILLRKRLRRY